MIRHIEAIGRYFLMLRDTFRSCIRWSVAVELVLKDIEELIFNSLGIISFISLFMGAVIAIQTSLNLTNPFIPKYVIGFTTRQSIILEFAPTIISVIMAGRIGSYITSSIGSMKVSEQIDALKIMGINPLSYLIMPKIIALMFYPFVIAIAMTIGIIGGWIAGVYGGYCSETDFVQGLLRGFSTKHVVYAFAKTYVFSFVLATVPAYHGYYMEGGSLEVGKATTKSFVWTAVSIIVLNYVITQMLIG